MDMVVISPSFQLSDLYQTPFCKSVFCVFADVMSAETFYGTC